MGGNALKTVQGKGRMSKEEYQSVKEEVVARLSSHYTQVGVPPEDPAKQDFGDVDVVCFRAEVDDTIAPPLEALFGSREVVCNASLISFEFRGRQIDLTQVCSQQSFFFKLVFCSYGGCVGTVIATCFCKPRRLLINSLRLAILLPFLNNHRKLLLTDDVWDALRFLGLDAQRWQQGFSDRTSLYEWLSTSHFFRAADIGPGTFSSSRPVLQDFSAFCQELHARHVGPIHPCTPDSLTVLTQALTFFHKTQEYESLAALHGPLIS